MSVDIETQTPTINWSIVRGDGEVYTIPVTQAGVPVDLTGATLWYTAKRLLTDADSAAVIRKGTLSPLIGITITNPAGGIAAIALLGTDTDGLADTKLYHDAQYQLAGEQPHTLFVGQLKITPDVTRTKL